jgi:hypothetical protein
MPLSGTADRNPTVKLSGILAILPSSAPADSLYQVRKMSNIENVILLHGGGLSYEVANQIINKLPPSINVRTISMSKSKDFQAALLGSGNNESTPIQQ